MTDKRMFLAGLAAGAIGGVLLVRHRTQPRRMPHLDISQKVLAETRGEVRAAMLAGARAGPLRRAGCRAAPLRPAGAAQASRGEHPARPGALPDAAGGKRRPGSGPGRDGPALHRLGGALGPAQADAARGRLPGRFALLRIANRLALKKGFPPEGWRIEWLEDSDRCIAYDIHECFYLKVLTAYGAAELTPHFCQGDDLLYGGVPGIAWERTKTLGRGDDLCNFRFRRTGHSECFRNTQGRRPRAVRLPGLQGRAGACRERPALPRVSASPTRWWTGSPISCSKTPSSRLARSTAPWCERSCASTRPRCGTSRS